MSEEDEFAVYLGTALADPTYRQGHDDAMRLHNVVDSLIAVRRERGMTQANVAAGMGVRQPTIAQFETETSDPKVTTVQRYARAVGVRVRFVVEEDL